MEDDPLAAYTRYIWLLSAMYNFEIMGHHIPGKSNVTVDLLSRWSNSNADYKNYTS